MRRPPEGLQRKRLNSYAPQVNLARIRRATLQALVCEPALHAGIDVIPCVQAAVTAWAKADFSLIGKMDEK